MPNCESWNLVRLAYATLAGVALVLGIIGLFLPLIPTAPFVIVSAWAAAKGSPRLHRWLWNHPHMGPMLQAWQEEGAISKRAKWLACIAMSISWLGLLIMGMNWVVLASVGAVMLAVCTYLITRPTPRSRR